MNVIEASGLGSATAHRALRECTLEVPAGHVAALVGPNGAGKSTLLNLAVGCGAVRGRGHRPWRTGGRVAGRALRHRVRRSGHAAVKNMSVADMIYVAPA